MFPLLQPGAPLPEQGGGSLLVRAVDLIQAHRALEQEVELVVAIAGSKDHIFGPEASLDHPHLCPLEVLQAEKLSEKGLQSG